VHEAACCFENKEPAMSEHCFDALNARRKGRGYSGRSPCTLQVGWRDAPSDLILRACDVSGRPSLVASLDVKTARLLAGQLLEAAEKVDT